VKAKKFWNSLTLILLSPSLSLVHVSGYVVGSYAHMLVPEVNNEEEERTSGTINHG